MKSANGSASPLQNKTILVVDDDALIRRSVRSALQFGGYAVLEAENGRQAVELSQSHAGPIDLVLTDFMMPVQHGLSVVDVLNKSRPDTKVILMSGVVSQQMLHPDDRALPHAFLEKPFTAVDLMRLIGELLDS